METRDRNLLLIAALGAFATFMLWPDSPGGGPPSSPLLRAQALALCNLYLPCSRVTANGRIVGDAHFIEMVKGYGGIGTTCGYLPAWMWWRLGCRDPRLVNREEPQDGLHYRVGMNISDVVNGGKALGAWKAYRVGAVPPQPGDVLYFQNAAFIDGTSTNPEEHVNVLDSWPAGGVGDIVTYDMGHSPQPEGNIVSRIMGANGNIAFLGSTRRLVGFVDLSLVPFTATPDFTDHTLAVA